MRTPKKMLLKSRSREADKLKIFVLNDLHFRAGVDGNPNAPGAKGSGAIADRYYYASPNNLRNFVQIANDEKPDLIVFNGDMCDQPSDYSLFNAICSELDPSIKTAKTLGNHDFDELTYEQLVEVLGYEAMPELGGSKFNQTFAIGNNTRVIMLDSTFNNNNEHGTFYENVCVHTDSLPWLSSVLDTTNELQVYICTHVGPHLRNIGYFDQYQSLALRDIVNTACTNNPRLKVRWLFGHHHEADITPYTNLGANNEGLLLPALIMYEEGRFTEISINGFTPTITKRVLPY